MTTVGLGEMTSSLARLPLVNVPSSRTGGGGAGKGKGLATMTAVTAIVVKATVIQPRLRFMERRLGPGNDHGES